MSTTTQTRTTIETPASGESNLPEGWALTRLGDICIAPQYGWTTSANKNGEGLKLLRTTDISGGVVDWSTVPACEEEPDNPEKYMLQPSDIVVSRAGSVGVSYLIKEAPRAIFASYLIRFRPWPPIESDFIALFLKSPQYWTAIAEESAGIAIPNVNASKMKLIELPIPPLFEQRRIVSKIEELFTQVDAARDRLTRVPKILKRFRQAVLAAACSGRLTADWRKTPVQCDSASLLERVLSNYEGRWKLLHKKRKPVAQPKGLESGWKRKYGLQDSTNGEFPDLPLGWAWVPLGMLGKDPLHTVQTGPFGAQLHRDEFTETGIPVVAVGNLTGMGFTTDGLYFVTPQKAKQLAKYDVQASDVLFARSGATLGKVCVAPSFVRDWRMTGHILRARFDSELLLPEYGAYALHGDQTVIAQVSGNIRGVTRPGFNTSLLEVVRLPLPPLKEQYEIVRRVEALFKLASAIEKRVELATKRAEKLTQAILAKAFRGELVPTEAELARREGRSYEPASALLARIHAERALPLEHTRSRYKLGRRQTKGPH